MRPVLFRRGRLVVHSYPAMLYLGLVLGTFAASLVARGYGLHANRFAVATFVLLIPALVGARLWFVLEHLSYYRGAPARIWRRSEGGAGLYGGLIVALIASAPILSALALPFGRFWDATAFTLLVGAIFTRVGCLLTGCCAGRASQRAIAVRLPNRAGTWERRYPTQLLEMGLCAVLLVGAVTLRADMPFAGALLVCVLGGYGIGRFALDFTREATRRTTGLAASQIVSLAGTVAAIGTLAIGGVG